MRTGPAALTDAGVWAVWGSALGYAATRVPGAWFATDSRLTRIRTWERHGRVWEGVGVRRWKRHVPELGALFGGTSKRTVPGRDLDGLATLATETRRAELVHWIAPLPLVAMPLWNPGWLLAVMVGYALVANVPCIVIQRYNRGRITRLLSADADRRGRGPRR